MPLSFVKLLGPLVPGANLPDGARVVGTAYELDPVTAAFNIGTMVRWLDFNDTWLAAEWGHPSDKLGGDTCSRGLRQPKERRSQHRPPFDGRCLTFPAEFHAQTAIEAAVTLHPVVAGRLDDIETIVIETQEAGVRIIDKIGPLANPADRDHCLQYMVAVALIHGRLTADDYEDEIAVDTRIDQLREKMEVTENKQFTVDYFDPDRRSIGNAVQLFFKDGTTSERIVVDYPVGHRRRRDEGIPILMEKFTRNLATQFNPQRVQDILTACEDQERLEHMAVDDFMELWVN